MELLEHPSTNLDLHGCIVDVDNRVVYRGSNRVRLSASEAELLRYLAMRPGRTISRDELLVEVWGYHNNVCSRTVDTTVRRLRGKIEDEPTNPKHLITVHGSGYRFEMGKGTSFDLIVNKPWSNIEPEHSQFIGRDRELRLIARHFAAGVRVVTLLGPGGMGKTCLARHYGLGLSDEVVWCDLTETRGATDVIGAVGRVLDILLMPSRDQSIDKVGYALSARGSSLFVLDNAEQVARELAIILHRWLGLAPDTRWLVTSRVRLNLRAEKAITLEGLPQADGVALFVERADLDRNAPVEDLEYEKLLIADIVRRLEGMPLAVELAAARARLLSLETITARLADSLALLAAPGKSGRHASLYAVIDASWESLATWEQVALAQCSVFRGGFFLEDAEAVIDLGEFRDAPSVMDVMQLLVDKSLVNAFSPVRMNGVVRCAMYETIRQYAAKKLAMLGESGVFIRHAAHMLERGWLLREAVERRESQHARERLTLELDNLNAIYERALGAAPEAALRAAVVIDTAVNGTEDPRIRAERLDRALQAGGFENRSLVAEALALLADARTWFTSIEQAREDLTMALGAAKGHQPVEAMIHLRTARVLGNSGHLKEAVAHARQAFDIACLTGDAALEARALGSMGADLIRQGLDREAESHLARARTLAQRLDLQRTHGNIMAEFGVVARNRNLFAEADRAFVEAGLAYRRAGYKVGEAIVLAKRAQLAHRQGRLEVADDLLVQAIAGHRMDGAFHRAAASTVVRGWIAIERGRFDDAEDFFRETLVFATSTKNEGLAGNAGSCIGVVDCIRGRFSEARKTLSSCAENAMAKGGSEYLGYVYAYLCIAEAGLDDLQASEAALENARRQLHADSRPADAVFLDLCAGYLDLARVRILASRGDEEGATACRRAAEARLDIPNGVTSDDVRIARMLVEIALSRGSQESA